MRIIFMALAFAVWFGSTSFSRAAIVKFQVDTVLDRPPAPPVYYDFDFTLPNPPIVLQYQLGNYFLTDGYWFYNQSVNSGGFWAGILFQGAQLYSGPENNPTFLLGNYHLFNEEFGIEADLTITSVPEPSTWVLMGLGFGSLGFAGYRRMPKVAPATVSA